MKKTNEMIESLQKLSDEEFEAMWLTQKAGIQQLFAEQNIEYISKLQGDIVIFNQEKERRAS